MRTLIQDLRYGIRMLARNRGFTTVAAFTLGGLRVGQNLGPALGPALGGLIYVRAGLEPAFLAATGAMFLALLVALTLPRSG